MLSLKTPSSYKTEVQGRSLFISLDSSVVTGSVSSQVSAFSESQNSNVLPLKDIDFRRGADGAGRVIVNLSSNQVGVDLQQQAKGIAIEFMRSSLPEGLRRKLDVTDFGTPVQTVTTSQAGERVRMLIESNGEWEHSAYPVSYTHLTLPTKRIV